MKAKHFTLICIILQITLVLNNVRAQNFAPVSAVWYYTRPLYQNPNVSYTKFESLKDTLVNGLNCRKIQLYRPTNSLGNPIVERRNFIFYSENNSVYYIEGTQQYILYDFIKTQENIGLCLRIMTRYL